MITKDFFHVVISSDSLSLPRPWNQKLVDDTPENFFRIEQTYPFLLKDNLEKILHQRVNVSNYAARASSIGRPSGMTPDLFSWMSSDVTIIHHGVVDCWLKDGQPRVALTTFTEYVTKIMDDKKKWGPKVPLIIIGILPTNQRMLEKFPTQNDLIREFNRVLRENTNSNNTIFMDVERFDVDVRSEIVHEDGHHLSRKGHRIYANKLAQEIITICELKNLETA